MFRYNKLLFVVMILLVIVLGACSSEQSKPETSTDKTAKAAKNSAEEKVLKNNITLSAERGTIREKVEFKVNELEPNTPAQLIWATAEGKYKIEDLYTVIGPEFTEKEVVLSEGTSDENGEWSGSFTIPEGFGGDHTIYVASKETKIGQIGFTVDPTFTMTPKSGPVGTEITIKAEGIGWSTYMRNWQLTYDNQYTGLISAVSTNGVAEAKIRAAGVPGKHILSIRTGYLGSPYINYKQSPYPDKPAPDLVFEVTDEKTAAKSYVEPIPTKAGNGLEMPKLVNKSGVEVVLDKHEGIVGEPVKMTAKGLPKNEKVELIFNTMRGSRVSGLGFSETNVTLGNVTTDGEGNLSYDFKVPDDLGGIPHRIDLKIGEEVYGQEYLRILPSIVDISPKSGPVGTKIKIKIKGGGWTEFDNAYYMTYDNAFAGYMCAFNSMGDLTFEVNATGDPGYHIIDLYPGIYKQKQEDTDMTLIPQLTYATDHPGSAMPAIRMGFEVTK